MTNKPSALGRYWIELRKLVSLAGPILGAQLAATGMTFVDTTMAGRYSTLDLAAIALGFSIWMPVTVLIRGVLMAILSIVAFHFGAGETKKIAKEVQQGLWLSILLSIFTLILINYSGSVFQWLNVESEIAVKSEQYLKALAWGIPAICMFQALACYCEGLGKTKPGMICCFVALVLNVPLNYVFIFGKLGFPELGGVGCGYATSICCWVMLLLMAFYIMTSEQHRKMKLFEHFEKPKLKVIFPQLKLGVPIGLGIFFEASIFSVVALLVGQLGPVVVSGHQITLNFSSIAFMVPLSLSMALTIRVGQALGAKDTRQAEFISYTGIVTTVMIATFNASIMLLIPEFVVSVYTKNQDIISLSVQLLVYAAIFQYADGIQLAANGALRGYKDTRIPMAMVLFACWVVALPLGYILGLTDWLGQPMGPHGLWAGLVIALTIGAVLLSLRLRIIILRNRTGQLSQDLRAA